MKLTKQDETDLREMGIPDTDILQIQDASLSKHTHYTLYENGEKPGRRISKAEAIRLLGRRTWLSGLSRSAFHYDAVRHIQGSKSFVLFDSGRLFAD